MSRRAEHWLAGRNSGKILRLRNPAVFCAWNVSRIWRIGSSAILIKHDGWLHSEIIALDGARPIDLLASEIGAYEIEQELIRIDYGMLA